MKHARCTSNGTARHARTLAILLAVLVALVLGGAPSNSWAGHDDEDEIEFKEATIFIEFNATDGDTGIQVFLDDDNWRKVTISDPNDKTIFVVKGRKTLGNLGLTELFFESVEPELGDLSLEDFLDLFPEGDYEFEGIRNDGVELESDVEFAHIIPCGPVVSPDEGDMLDPTLDVVVSWFEVTQVVVPDMTDEDAVVCEDSDELEIDSYQVIVESPAGELIVDLDSDATELTIPPELVVANAAYKFEVLAKEESGNQTITESFFCTGPDVATVDECEELAEAL